MTTVQVRNDEMAELLTSDLLPAQDRAHVIEMYYSGSDVVFAGTPSLVLLNTTRLNTSADVYIAGTNEIILQRAGIYLVTAYMRVGRSGSSGDNACFFWIDQNPGTGFYAEVPAARGGIHVPNGGTAGAEVSVRLRVSAGGYRYRMQVQRDWGADNLVYPTQGAKLSVVRLFGLP